MVARKQDGSAKFDAFFDSIYGDRWPGLRQALQAAPIKVGRENPFGLAAYQLDPASTLPVQLLKLEAGLRIADFCASPGGKLLTGVFQLRAQAEWHAFDLSKARLARLRAVLHDCLPADLMARIQTRALDAALIGRRDPESFDRVLVDAPCSGERHLLDSPKEIARWSAKGSQRLAVRQHALLCSAIDAAKPGARVVYSTCSLSPVENDGVIDRLFKSRAGGFQVLRDHVWISGDWPALLAEPTRHGWLVLPDRNPGAGPIYAAALLKRAD